MVQILREFLRAVVHRHLALGQNPIHFPARQVRQVGRLAQSEDVLCIEGNSELQAEALRPFQLR